MEPLQPILNRDGTLSFRMEIENKSDVAILGAFTFTQQNMGPNEALEAREQIGNLERVILEDARGVYNGYRAWPFELDAHAKKHLSIPGGQFSQESFGKYQRGEVIIVLEFAIVYQPAGAVGKGRDIYYGERFVIMNPTDGYQEIPGLNFSKHIIDPNKLRSTEKRER